MTNQHSKIQNQIILTGDRATGPLHLGHYVGSLRQRVTLQNHNEQTILVADMQGLPIMPTSLLKSLPTFLMLSPIWP